MTMFALVASFSVHCAKRIKSLDAQTDLLLFACGSALFKISMQELAKWGALRTKVRDIRLMCVSIGIPTVLIDTQTRLVVQRIQSTQGTITGALLVAFIEIAMRISKLALVRLEIHRHERAKQSSPTVASLSPVPSNASAVDAGLARWKRRVWSFYMAEVYSDMAAEYIAIGCSTSILYFYRSHPTYQLSATAIETPSSLDQLVVLAVQVSIEVVVDLLACSLEISRGMDFRELRKHDAFILAFFVHLAVVNIQISTAIYLIP